MKLLKRSKIALVSVSNKKGLPPFARGLVRLGFKIIATGGTAKVLKEKSIPVKTVAESTGFKELLGGRIKTLHPAIFGGILALRNRKHPREMAREEIELIDIVIVNLHPFRNMNSMDIGGAALIRSAVKNFKNVGVVIDHRDYKKTLGELRKGKGRLSLESRERLAKKALAYILNYDGMIYKKWTKVEFPEELFLRYRKVQDLRYGENPHQAAAL